MEVGKRTGVDSKRLEKAEQRIKKANQRSAEKLEKERQEDNARFTLSCLCLGPQNCFSEDLTASHVKFCRQLNF